ncbi:MAG: hypothetical protein ABIP93_19650 [Gemmatimonadaceae bacterium]
MIDETRARFLSSIASQLQVERVAEVHLFPAIRQGGMESGVAVLALDLAIAPEPSVDESPTADASAEQAAVIAEQLEEENDADFADDSSLLDESDLPNDGDVPEQLDERDGRAEEADDEMQPAARPIPRRFTVYTARYRHTLKGPDRGKWEVSVTEEADAPLLTVDAVVRGVQRRSGDVDDIVRLTGDEMRASILQHQ